MSYVFDGKVSNQVFRYRLGGVDKVVCAKCGKLINAPESSTMKALNGNEELSYFFVYHYVGRSSFIYETKSGFSVIYCSEYCRNKHNHRFRK